MKKMIKAWRGRGYWRVMSALAQAADDGSSDAALSGGQVRRVTGLPGWVMDARLTCLHERGMVVWGWRDAPGYPLGRERTYRITEDGRAHLRRTHARLVAGAGLP